MKLSRNLYVALRDSQPEVEKRFHLAPDRYLELRSRFDLVCHIQRALGMLDLKLRFDELWDYEPLPSTVTEFTEWVRANWFDASRFPIEINPGGTPLFICPLNVSGSSQGIREISDLIMAWWMSQTDQIANVPWCDWARRYASGNPVELRDFAHKHGLEIYKTRDGKFFRVRQAQAGPGTR